MVREWLTPMPAKLRCGGDVAVSNVLKMSKVEASIIYIYVCVCKFYALEIAGFP